MRAVMRYKDIFITAPRAFSKSFITILGLIL
uniref:Terminase large subunit n=1 Tax=Siphoviridae sp. ct2vX3 TaxID=2825318 RepID=A0A8S5PX54_9CAUD|nr:MAG TPA: Terminase large subunit [Siphoviridae sp. ct2vX3]